MAQVGINSNILTRNLQFTKDICCLAKRTSFMPRGTNDRAINVFKTDLNYFLGCKLF